ncbi:MAG: tol-pal system-associated acyl-CoA thioesterase [Alphaproteobacteria bacterium]|nr:MAG: tol-pal system-associated acyl-CoA thioesterase [Alphaproteobacteria bacterium]TMJ43843.1 MAG: tol-pal system-associated acyl-CoA thioesterase [Alphaproteobacteria bacterium]
MTEWKDLAGRIEKDRHVLPVRVYYEDTDFSGAVYHANYLKFCERGRSDCLRLLGVHHHEMHWHETEGRMGFVVRRMLCDFRKPARIDDLLEIETRFREMRGARMELDQKVLRECETLFAAQVTVVLVDAAGRPKRFPKAMAEALKTF